MHNCMDLLKIQREGKIAKKLKWVLDPVITWVFLNLHICYKQRFHCRRTERTDHVIAEQSILMCNCPWKAP